MFIDQTTMKYTCEITINKPLDVVVKLFDNPANLREWMQGLQRFETISGIPGQPGAKTRLLFQSGKRSFEMLETITVRNLPVEFTGVYETGNVVNISKNSFIPVSESVTKYVSEQEFTLQGWMKLMGLLMPGAFKKQSMKYLKSFKGFVERTN